nr:tubby-like F-box protein 5 [Ipomoea batatas]
MSLELMFCHKANRRGRSYVAPERLPQSPPPLLQAQESPWADLPCELLLNIIWRVEANETTWPGRRDVVSCAAVCRSWRQTTKWVVRTPLQSGLLTFPCSLKLPGPKDSPIQCFIKRERSTSTFRLYLGLTPAFSVEAGKLLMTAKKNRRPMSTDFLISLSKDDFSQSSDNYVGKLRSNFLGTKLSIHDSQPSCNTAIQMNNWSCKRFLLKKGAANPQTSNYRVATISYEINLLRTRGPRRMQCAMHTIPFSAMQEGGSVSTPTSFQNYKFTSPLSVEKPQGSTSGSNPLILRNKSPRWHEQLQCWCLNFKGRVTVASVKNFQLMAAVDASQNVAVAEQEKVILQFGKIGKDIFTMDYCYPLSAFQAFAICLSSFDTKPACE